LNELSISMVPFIIEFESPQDMLFTTEEFSKILISYIYKLISSLEKFNCLLSSK
jgi:hypothetical protein